jgi:hypothetical protein
VSVDNHYWFIRGTDKAMRRGLRLLFGVGGFPTRPRFCRGARAWLCYRLLELGNLPETIGRNAFLHYGGIVAHQHLLEILPGGIEILTREGLITQANVFSHIASL